MMQTLWLCEEIFPYSIIRVLNLVRGLFGTIYAPKQVDSALTCRSRS
uniref:Uncharacterized protein n=1 Tax=Arundo donax TaxID=35708 RepID=A0A0A8XRW3_ARUDO